jgi:hypothetical protein
MAGSSLDSRADDLSRGIARLRCRRRQLIVYFFSVIPIAIIFTGISWLALGQARAAYHWNSWFVWVLFGIWVVLVVRYGFSRCPRCHKLFYTTIRWSNRFSRRCLHCGLDLFSPAA